MSFLVFPARADNAEGILPEEALIEVIEASINTCNITSAENYMQQLGKRRSSEDTQLQNLKNKLQDKLGQIDRHRQNLTELAKQTQDGDIDDIKQSVRKAMTTINCPEDRMRLVEVVKRIQLAMKQEVKRNQRAMEYAINKGQYSQNEKYRQRRLIGQTLLLLVGSMDFGEVSIPVPDIDKEQYLTDLATMGIKQYRLSSNSSDSVHPPSSKTICSIRYLASRQKPEDDNSSYYLDIGSAKQDGRQYIVYQIKSSRETIESTSRKTLGPYKTLQIAQMVAERICPFENRLKN